MPAVTTVARLATLAMAGATATEGDSVVFTLGICVGQLLLNGLLLWHVDGEKRSTCIASLMTLINTDPLLELKSDIIELSSILKDLIMLITSTNRLIGLHVLALAHIYVVSPLLL